MHPKLPSAWRRNGLVAAFVLLSSGVLFSQASAPEVRGKVCDAANRPIASATVILKDQDQAASLRAQTGADGMFVFSPVHAGSYHLQVSAAGFVEVSRLLGPVPAEGKIFELIVLRPELKTELKPEPQSQRADGTSSSSSSPSFFDPPQFTVSGVTDTTNLGGHGSGPMTRNRESLEKDVSALGGNSKVPEPKPAAGAYDRALSSVNAGDYARARQQLQALVAEHPTADAHHLLAVVDEKLGSSLDAVHEYQRAAELDPSEPNVFDWGSELLLHHAAEPAIEVFSDGSRRFPRSTRMLVGLGAAEYAAGSPERADQRLCEASDIDPENPLPYQFLGKIQRSESAVPAEVLERFRRFQKLRPENGDANYLYAVALWKQNQPTPSDAMVKQIESLLMAALRVNPKFAGAYLQLGIVHSWQQHRATAILDFQHAVENEPELAEAHYRLAQAYRAMGRTDDARAEVEAYERLTRESAERTEREHREIQQFVYSLRDKSAVQSQ